MPPTSPPRVLARGFAPSFNLFVAPLTLLRRGVRHLRNARVQVMVLITVASMLGPARLLAQRATRRAPPGIAGCYRLALGEWSRPLGGNALYHAIPSIVRLDTARAMRGGWRALPDIRYPTPNRLRGTPSWTAPRDTVEIMWSNGFQSTTLRLGRHGAKELRGTAVVWSDANEFGTDLPRAKVVARRTACPPT
jgi:hypothetical protein